MTTCRLAATGMLLFFVLPQPACAASSSTMNASRARGMSAVVRDNEPRPRVLIKASELPALRRVLHGDNRRARLYRRGILSDALDWSMRPVVIPARAGHYHNFVCTDGTRLVFPHELVYGAVTPEPRQYRCPVCGKVYSGEKFDAAVRREQHVALIEAAFDLAFAGRVERNKAFLRKSAEILVKYADAYPGRHTGATTGGIFYQSLDEAVFFIPLAQAYDLIADTGVLTDAQREHISRDLFRESAEGLIHCGVGGNWGSWHLSAVGVIGFAIGDQRLIDYGLDQFRLQIKNQLGSDGLWPESIQTYHFYPMRGFISLADAAANSGIDLYNWEGGKGRSLRAMFLRPLEYMYPDFRLPAINDGWYDSWLPLDIYEAGYDRLHLPELGWVVRELRGNPATRDRTSLDTVKIWSVIHGVPISGPVHQPDFQSTCFTNIGIATLRTGPRDGGETMLTFDYGRFLGHGQFDKMGVTLFAGGHVLMPDYGTPSYGSAILHYYRGTSSHNTVMVDGKNQAPSHINGLKYFQRRKNGVIAAACAETTETTSGVKWRRTVALCDDYALVLDALDSTSFHHYESLFHCEASTAALSMGRHPEECTVDWITTPGSPVLRLVAASRQNLAPRVFFQPAETGTRLVPGLSESVRGTAARFANVLQPAKNDASPVTGVRVRKDGQIIVRSRAWQDTWVLSKNGIIRNRVRISS